MQKILILIVVKLVIFIFVKKIHFINKEKNIQIPSILKLSLIISLLPFDFLLIKNLNLPIIYCLDIWVAFFSLSLMKSSYNLIILYIGFRLITLGGFLVYSFIFDSAEILKYLLASDINKIYELYPIIHPVYFIVLIIGAYYFFQVFFGKILFNDKHHIKDYGYFLDSIKRKRGLHRVIYAKEKPTTSTIENAMEIIFYPLITLQNKMMTYYLKPTIYFWNKPVKLKRYDQDKKEVVDNQVTTDLKERTQEHEQL